MLRSGNDGLHGLAVPDLEEPGPAPLAEDGPGLPVEPPVGHPHVDARLADDVDLLADLELLDGGHDRRDPPPADILLQLAARFLPRTMMVCHYRVPSCSPTSSTSRWMTRAGLPRRPARLGRVLPPSPDTSSFT